MSKVYFSSARMKKLNASESLPKKLPKLLEEAGIGEIVEKGNIVAIKIHFGDLEGGGFRYVRPIFARAVSDVVKEHGGIPFFTDTWGLKHVLAAIRNGFNYTTLGAPILPANGIKENFFYTVKLYKYFHLQEVDVAGNIYDADVLINLSHVKGHPSSGMGGAIKNIAMGCTSYKIRGEVHKLERNDNDGRTFQEAMIDVVKAVLRNKVKKHIHINAILDVQPMCDCAPFSDLPIVPDIGIAVSRDPIAVEKFSLDAIDQAPPMPMSLAEKLGLKSGDNKFFKIHGKNPYHQVYAGVKANLGSDKYEVIEI